MSSQILNCTNKVFGFSVHQAHCYIYIGSTNKHGSNMIIEHTFGGGGYGISVLPRCKVLCKYITNIIKILGDQIG